MLSYCHTHESHGNLFYRGKSDDQDEYDHDGDDGDDDEPNFKWGRPKPKPMWTSWTGPDGCNYMEMFVKDKRRFRDVPKLTCDPMMRKLAELHAQNIVDDGFAGRVKIMSCKLVFGTHIFVCKTDL